MPAHVSLKGCFASVLLLASLFPCLLFPYPMGMAHAAPVPTSDDSHQVVQTQLRLAHLTGTEIIRESVKRHELYPYVFEAQTLILTDAHKQHDVRRMQRYSRMEKDGVFKTKLEFVYPDSIAGTVLLFVHHPDGSGSSRIFLPALGAQLTDYVGAISGGQILGSEFSLEDFMPEDMASFVYHRIDDVVVDSRAYFVVRADLSTSSAASDRSYAERILFVRQDNFFISRVDYFDNKAHLIKRQTSHNIHPVGGKMWRADMVKVENMLNRHSSILKIDQRIFSSDYAPESAFDANLLLVAAKRKDDARKDHARKDDARKGADDAAEKPDDAQVTGSEEKP